MKSPEIITNYNVFPETSRIQSNDKDMAGLPTSADMVISDKTSPLLPASSPSQPLLHLSLSATLFGRYVIDRC